MRKRRSRLAPTFATSLDALEGRTLLSGAYAALPHGTAEVAARANHNTATPTKTTMSISTGTLGRPITFHVTVRAGRSGGAPEGQINIVQNGNVVGSFPVSPSKSGGKSGVSDATVTLMQEPGGSAFYFGKHSLTAEFVPSGPFSASSATRSFDVREPIYTTLSDGAKVAIIGNGSGPAIQSGQTASVMYTGYLASTGQIFDDSMNDGGAPFSFTLGAGQVIPGFDAGVTGMQAGETRIIEIPPAEGYGATANGPIPANSTLIFVVTLESIS
jgi:hypothetical protein